MKPGLTIFVDAKVKIMDRDVVNEVTDDTHVRAVVVDAYITITGDIEALNVNKTSPVRPGGSYTAGNYFRSPFDIRDEGNTCLCCTYGCVVYWFSICSW